MVFTFLGITLAYSVSKTAIPTSTSLPVKAEVLAQHIAFLSAKPRHHPNTQGLDEAAEYIKAQIEHHGLPCRYQNYSVEGLNYRNVVCSINPDNPELVIVGAHYDTYADLPGADDNASGVAGVIELARVLQAQKDRLPYQVELVAYTLEEPPFFRTEHMGSAIHAQSLANRPESIKAVVILEMIGFFSEEAIQDYPLSMMKTVYPKHGNFIAAIGNWQSKKLTKQYCQHMSDLKQLFCERLTAPSSLTGVDFSDHLNYWQRDIPAIMITDTSFYRNKHYHTPEDTLDKLNMNKAAAVVDGVSNWLLSGQVN